MMNKTIKGLTLKVAPFKENDLLLTVFTAESGKMNILCRGIRRSKKTQLYAQPFVYSEFDLFCGRGLAVADGAQVCEAFAGLRNDIENLSLAQYFCDVVSFSARDQNCKEQLRLLLNSLALLSDGKVDARIVKIVFELRYAQYEGFAPSADGCTICGKPIAFWKFGEGFLCQDCARGGGHAVTGAVLDAIRHILTTDGMRTYSFRMNQDALQYLSRLTELNLCYHLDTEFSSLQYYRQFTDLR